MKKAKKKAVVIGAGFGGIIAVKELLRRLPGKFDITIIDKNDYHLFKPALYKVAAGLAELPLMFPAATINLADIFLGQKVKILKKEIKGVKTEKEKAVFKGGGAVSYDYLIVSTGSEPNFRNIAGAKTYSLTLQNFEDALAIKQRVEEAVKNKPKREEINIVIVGAGLAGCEMAAETVFYLRNLVQIYGHPKSLVKLKLVEVNKRILPSAGGWLAGQTEKRLKELGVEIIVGAAVKQVKEKEILLSKNDKLIYDVLIWTAGVKPLFFGSSDFSVTPSLRLGRQKNIFVIGDACCGKISSDKEGGVPMAQVAIHQAEYIAWILASLNKVYAPLFFWRKMGNPPPYKNFKPIFVAHLGEKFCLAEIRHFKIKGILARWIKNLSVLNYFTRILPWRLAFKQYKKYRSV